MRTSIDLFKRYSAIGDQSMRHGSPAIMMRTAGMELNMKSMVKWRGAGGIQLHLERRIRSSIPGRKFPIRDKLKFFEKDLIDWTGGMRIAWIFIRTCLNCIAVNPASWGGDPEVITHIYLQTASRTKNVLAYWRKKDDREVIVLLNLSAEDNMKFQFIDV